MAQRTIDVSYFVSTRRERLRVVEGVRTFSSDNAESIRFEKIPYQSISIKNCPDVSIGPSPINLDSLRLTNVFGCSIPQGSVFLRTLKLRGCGLVGNIDFGHLRVWYLDVRENSLSTIDVSGCDRLRKLVMSHTLVKKVVRDRGDTDEGLAEEIKCEQKAYVKVPEVTVFVHPSPRDVLKIKMTEYV